MKSRAPYLVVLFAGTTIAVGILAWRQYNELVELRAGALDRGERAGLQKRLWELEKTNRSLQEKIAAKRSASDGEPANAGDKSDSAEFRHPAEGSRRGDIGLQQAAAIRELLTRPEVQAMLNQQQKAGIEARYAPLFKLLNLTAAQAEKLTALLAERNTTRQDIFAAAQEQGINPRANPEAFRKLLTDAQNELNRGIQSVIGESGLAQLQFFEQTVPQRALVGELQQRLSYTATPLTPAQSEQLIQILAKDAPSRTSDAGAPPAGLPPPGSMPGRLVPVDFLGGGGPPPPGAATLPGVIESAFRVGGAPISNAALTEAQAVLSPPQAATLQQMQQQQVAQQQLQQMFRDATVPGSVRTPPAGDSTIPQAAPKQRRPGG